MSRKINLLSILGIFLLACIGFAVGFSISSTWVQPQPEAVKPASQITPLGSDRAQDGLSGPVNRVRTETAKLTSRSGKLFEGPRQLLELTTYDRQGQRIESSYSLVYINPQVGVEEYGHDDKGNVSEMTLRGSNNEILRKEAYTYEMDDVGNWVKMVTSTILYEEGKMSRQPTEVTYRNITYYFDQSIAEIVKPNPKEMENPSGSAGAQENFASLRVAFDGWLAATNAHDLEKLISFYSPKMEAFYRARNVSQDVVIADRARMFRRADKLEVRADDPEITISGDGQTATMRFNKSYLMRVMEREHHGKVIQQLRWQLTPEGWKIVSERDLKVLERD